MISAGSLVRIQSDPLTAGFLISLLSIGSLTTVYRNFYIITILTDISQINQDKLLLTAGGNKQNLLIVINLFGESAA